MSGLGILQNYNITISTTNYTTIISLDSSNNQCAGTINILNLTSGYSTNFIFNSLYSSGTTAMPENQIVLLNSMTYDPTLNVYFSYINGEISVYNISASLITLNIAITGSFSYSLPLVSNLTTATGTPTSTVVSL